MCWSVDENIAIGGSQEPNFVFSLGAMVQYAVTL